MAERGLDEVLASAVRRVKGIAGAAVIADEDRPRLLAIEKDAQARSLMGLGEVINTGVQGVLGCELVAVGLTRPDFDWGCHASLVLKKGDEVVGEEVRDPEVLARLSGQKNVWFLHRNFVVYRDRVVFPSDIMQKICHFEIPGAPADWCAMDDPRLRGARLLYANPCTPGDVFLKEAYFHSADERGLGTVLVGASP